MTKVEADRAAEMLQRLLGVLIDAPVNRYSDAAANVRRAAGELSAVAYERIMAWGFGAELAACFRAVTAAGATFDTLNRIIVAARAETETSPVARAVVAIFIRLALVEQATLLATASFKSRDQVEAIIRTLNTSFGDAIEYAADAGQQGVYRTLLGLHGSVVRDLTRRARPLPQVVTYKFPGSIPILAVANRLYGDASRADELIAENSIRHPLFPSATLRALSA